ncbi:signal transduction histidine kinase [Chamaesiphon minutus PCC 6605]|uniref:histidine kinase n=2 Tax=Chamaesiphon TaxID=217161 RepID=K9UK68_CHAP6|nr:signal transduction histidine kinase [Chamaesiphon minutus PCC 6605]
MLNSEQDLDINPDRQIARSRSLQSPPIVTELSIEQSQVPIFAEATAQVARLTDAPVAILTAIAGSGDRIASVYGLERLILPTKPNLISELAGLEYCHDRIFASQLSLSIVNFQQHPQLSQSSLCRRHELQSYLGVPIITAARDCLGTISILDFKPRQFSDRDIELLQLVSRLVASEFERKLLSQAQLERRLGNLHEQAKIGFDDPAVATEHNQSQVAKNAPQPAPASCLSDKKRASKLIPTTAANCRLEPPQAQTQIQSKLLAHLAQELRTPLTSVLGMASVLQQEIYGPLSSKQKDYLGIIHHSGRQLVTIVDEISQLGGCDATTRQLTLKSVDLEMLCQLAIQSLESIATKKQQQIKLDLADNYSLANSQPDESATPPIRVWLLDKDKVRQIVYYLCLSLIHVSGIDRHISIQFATMPDGVEIQIATDDPNAILPNADLSAQLTFDTSQSIEIDRHDLTDTKLGWDLRISLGLSLSHTLAASHGGKIQSLSDGCGYCLILPLIVN